MRLRRLLWTLTIPLALNLVAIAPVRAHADASCARTVIRNLRDWVGPFSGYGEFLESHSQAELQQARAKDPAFDRQIREGRVLYRDGRWLLKMLPKYKDEASVALPGARNGRPTSYVSAEDKAWFRVTVKNGKFVTRDGHTLASQNVDFVIDRSGDVYFFNTREIPSPRRGLTLHHSSFPGGAPVEGAGQIRFNRDGSIARITPASGHYEPSDRFTEQAVSIFKSQGADLRFTQTMPLREYLNPSVQGLGLIKKQ